MRTYATSSKAQFALKHLSQVQETFASKLAHLDTGSSFQQVEWLRDEGMHGGGKRFEATSNNVFNRASINVSQIHYEQLPEKNFLSATALSTIIHPQHPLAPSMHLHVSWTELKNGQQYWRIMADLNPAIEDKTDTQLFNNQLKELTGHFYEAGKKAGDRYFDIPALGKHRGVSHFYLEGFTGEVDTSEMFAINFAGRMVDCYTALLSDKISYLPPPSNAQLAQQVAYHTLYFYQVLTLDKGTTAGLLVHDQNDIGTLASLPAYINNELLAQWITITPAPQKKLVSALVASFPDTKTVHITPAVKVSIAQIIRQYYSHL